MVLAGCGVGGEKHSEGEEEVGRLRQGVEGEIEGPKGVEKLCGTRDGWRGRRGKGRGRVETDKTERERDRRGKKLWGVGA